MRRKSALEALEAINAKVHACTENEVRPEVIECLENAARKLFDAVQGDAYAREQMNALVVFLRADFLRSPSKLITYRQDILDSVKALYSYISRRTDFPH